MAPDANEEYLIYQTIAGAWPWKMERRRTGGVCGAAAAVHDQGAE